MRKLFAEVAPALSEAAILQAPDSPCHFSMPRSRHQLPLPILPPSPPCFLNLACSDMSVILPSPWFPSSILPPTKSSPSPIRLPQHPVPLTEHTEAFHTLTSLHSFIHTRSHRLLEWGRYCVCFICVFPAQDEGSGGAREVVH